MCMVYHQEFGIYTGESHGSPSPPQPQRNVGRGIIPKYRQQTSQPCINGHLIEIERCGVSTVVVIPVHVQHLMTMTCRIAKLIMRSNSGS